MRTATRSMLRLLVVLGVVAPLALPTAGAADRQRHVLVGDFDGASLSQLNAFYPRSTTLHEGDSILFRLNGFHTVTYVPDAIPRPTFVEQIADPYEPEDDLAGEPWWWGGVVGEYRASFDIVFPSPSNVVDGRRIVNSGLMGSKFEVLFREAGDFKLYCAIHPKMTEVVHVLPEGEGVTATEQQQRADRQRAEDAAASEAAFAEWTSLPRDTTTVLTGPGDRDFSSPQFYPSDPRIRVGQTLRFVVPAGAQGDPHTVTFGPDELLEELGATLFPQTADLVFPPVQTLPSEPPGERDPVVVSPTTHGVGFVNTGLFSYPSILDEVLGPTPPAGQQTTFAFRFTEPGTYHFECLVHFGFMEGDVTVTA